MTEGCEFRGVIDRLIRNNKGHWTIIDWKSNDLLERNPLNVAKENYYHLQLACYKWVVERITGEKVNDMFIYFTDNRILLRSSWKGGPDEIK